MAKPGSDYYSMERRGSAGRGGMADQNVTLKTLEQICDRLKCSISDIFGGD
jgi:hypothetical protein